MASWLLAAACTRPTLAPTDGGTDASAMAVDVSALAKAEDLRHAADVPAEARTRHDVATRRRSARALARIASAESVDGLAALLMDEDPETVAWAGYGLGYTCKGHEDTHVRMLAARKASLAPSSPVRSARGTTELDPHVAIARAIGRCATPLAEQVLVGFLKAAREGDLPLDPALLGLGDLATRRKQLGPDAVTALLDTAGDKSHPNDLAFYALSRAEPGEAFARRVVDVARVALGRPGDARILAIRALGRAGKANPRHTAKELARVVTDATGYDEGERAEASRALGSLGDAGQNAVADAINTLTPDAKDSIAITNLTGRSFNVLYTLLGQLGVDTPKSAEPSLAVLAALTPADERMLARQSFARRLAELRCSAALALARGMYDAEVLQKCDETTSEASEKARLTSLGRRPLTHARLDVFRRLAKSEHVRIREAAIEMLGSHAEIGEAGTTILADALGAKHGGLVASAAEVLHAHPERAMVLSPREKRAALDPRSPPPTAAPEMVIAPVIEKALSDAMATSWPEDRFETRISLLEAAASVHHPRAKELATNACTDANPVVRERALSALRTIGADTKPCDAPRRDPKLAAEIDAPLARPTRIVLSTEMHQLAIVLEPELSPITATRIASLVRSGFYKGIVIHRVVPGFVVQLGDPDGDGYGGSGSSLRCETSPVAFHRLDVGMALAGRDTGSSQFFVTLSRTPHLEGEYTRVGRAEGDWSSVAQGDVIMDARVVE